MRQAIEKVLKDKRNRLVADRQRYVTQIEKYQEEIKHTKRAIDTTSDWIAEIDADIAELSLILERYGAL